MKKYLCAVFFSVLMLQTSAFSGEKIRYAVFPAPPYMIGADREGRDDAKLKKQEVTSQDQLFPMLMNDRFEAMAGNLRLPTDLTNSIR